MKTKKIFALFLTMFIFVTTFGCSLVSADTVKGGPNLFLKTANLGFEATKKGAPRGWAMSDNTAYDSFEVSTMYAHTGKNSGKTTLSEPKEYSPCVQHTGSSVRNIELQVGTTYEISVWVNTGEEALEGPGVRLRIMHMLSDGTRKNVYSKEGDITDTKGEWQKLTCEFTADTDKPIYNVYLFASPGTTGVCYWDDLALRDLTETRDSNLVEEEYQAAAPTQEELDALKELEDIAPMPEGISDAVVNGGFENVDGSGNLIGEAWGVYKNTWQGDVTIADGGYESDKSLKISTKTKENPWARFSMEAVPGAEYQVALCINTVPDCYDIGVKIEYYNAEGANFNSSHSPSFGDSTRGEWKRIGFKFTAPNDTVKVSLYLRLYGAGEVRFDNLQVYQTSVPSKINFDGDTFFYTEWETGTVSAYINELAYEEAPDTCVFDVRLKDGESVLKEEKGLSASENADFTFDLSMLEEIGKEYKVEATLYDAPGGNVVDTSAWSVYRYNRPTAINEKGQYIVNGEEFVPVVGYHVYDADWRLKDAKAAGVNVVQGGGDTVESAKIYLDNCQANGMMGTLLLYAGMKSAGHKTKIENTIEVVKAMKDHPALFGYLVMDEPYLYEADPYNDLARAYKAIRDIDPVHPVIIQDSAATGSSVPCSACSDILIIHDYALNTLVIDSWGIAGTTSIVKRAKAPFAKTNVTPKPLYFLGQTFGLDTREEAEAKGFRYFMPNIDQLRNMLYQGVWGGCMSVGFYSFREAATGDLAERPLYKDMVEFAKEELNWLNDEFILDKHLLINENKNGDIWWRISANGDKAYLLALNMGFGAKETTVKLESRNGMVSLGSYSGRLIGGLNQAATISGNGTVAVKLDEHGVLLYELTLDKMPDLSSIRPMEFTDLGAHEWAKEQILSLADKGILNSMGEGIYAPGQKITRADFAMFLIRTLGLTSDNTENFADVDAAAYYGRELAIGKALGILKGVGDGVFNPEAEISRQDMMVIAARGLRMIGKLSETGQDDTLAAFSDKESIADYAKGDVAAMVKSEIIKGNADGTVNPLGNTTRAEAAVIMHRIYEK